MNFEADAENCLFRETSMFRGFTGDQSEADGSEEVFILWG